MIPSQLQPLVNHLWQSTLFVAVAGLLTLALGKNQAQTRYGLWLAASVKFLIPFSILVQAGSHFGRQTPSAIPQSSLSSVIEQVSRPFALSVSFAAPPAAQPSSANLILAILCAAWAIGFVILVSSWWQRWRVIRAALRTASPLHLPINMEAVTSPAFQEPGVFGILRPVLLLPDGIIGHLTPPQLEAILTHELCHVRRRDNLATAVHLLVEAVFWFHPLVWWLGARLMEERERACDEEVLRMGTEPEVYAEGILKICELYVESRLQCVAGVTGANLKKRIEAIMTNRIALGLNSGKKLLLAATGLLAASGPLIVGMANGGLVKAQSEARLAFEVASVRQRVVSGMIRRPWSSNIHCPPLLHCGISGNKFNEEAASLTDLIMDAYAVKRFQISGLPRWGDTGFDVYDIVARVEGDKTPTIDQARRMLQALLADRFQLKLHHETRELPVYALVAAKNGPKLTPMRDACSVPGLAGGDGGRGGGGGDDGWKHLLDMLSVSQGGAVIDRTGLEGRYCTLDGQEPLMAVTDADSTIFTAVEEKLGLKLLPQKGPVDVLVIDSVERPSEN